MALKRGFFGSIKSVSCARCGICGKPHYLWCALCNECYPISPSILREEDFKDSGWGDYTKKWAKHIKCSICGKIGNPEIFQHVCFSCKTTHPDSTHRTSWGYAPQSNPEFEHCHLCEGIVVKKKIDPKGTMRTYYKVGEKEPTNHPYGCPENSKELKGRQIVCEHDFLEIYSNAKSVQKAALIEADLRSQPVVSQIMASDMGGLEHNLAYASEGSTRFWCWKCGCYLNLNPSRYHLLPKRGTPQPD